MHDAREHIIGLRQFLVHKKRPLSPRYDGDQLGQIVFVEDIGHAISDCTSRRLVEQALWPSTEASARLHPVILVTPDPALTGGAKGRPKRSAAFASQPWP